MNKINFKIETYEKSNALEIGGIFFDSSILIKLIVDGEDVIQSKMDGDALLNFDAFFNSTKKDGRYLLFTSLTGIADDGGWDYIEVKHQYQEVLINFTYSNYKFDFKFSKKQYLEEVEKTKLNIELIKRDKKHLTLEPRFIVYPE
jgi:hypothetical protein